VAGALVPLLGGWLLASSLWAGEARLVQADRPDLVVVETNDASVDEVLAALSARFEFVVERNAPPSRPIRFTGRLKGSLHDLLERLLRHEAHVIVRSSEARGGVSRILLLETKGGPPPPTLAGPIAALKSKLQEREEGKGK
jgi:hypothetical protein